MFRLRPGNEHFRGGVRNVAKPSSGCLDAFPSLETDADSRPIAQDVRDGGPRHARLSSDIVGGNLSRHNGKVLGIPGSKNT